MHAVSGDAPAETPVELPVNSLPLDVCPGCAYQLQGLPPEGVCPECGRPYDQNVVFLYGWARGSKADPGNAKGWHALALAALPLLFCVAQVYRGFRRGDYIRMVLYGTWAAMIVALVWRRFTFRGPGLAQVRLGAAGCVQADSTAEADAATPTAWDKVEAVTLERAGDELWHLRLAGRASWWGSGTAYVDAEVKCGDARAEALRERIEGWRNVAGATPATTADSADTAEPASPGAL